jgi:hypothetical protein
VKEESGKRRKVVANTVIVRLVGNVQEPLANPKVRNRSFRFAPSLAKAERGPAPGAW